MFGGRCQNQRMDTLRPSSGSFSGEEGGGKSSPESSCRGWVTKKPYSKGDWLRVMVVIFIAKT